MPWTPPQPSRTAPWLTGRSARSVWNQRTASIASTRLGARVGTAASPRSSPVCRRSLRQSRHRRTRWRGGRTSATPSPACSGAVTAMQTDRAVVQEHFARRPGLLLLGADPLRAPRRIHPGAATERWNGSSRAAGTGAMGAAMMMTATASIQVNIDAGPRDAGPNGFGWHTPSARP